MGRIRARQVRDRDFTSFDHILAMDARNYAWLVDACPRSHGGNLSLVTAWNADGKAGDIPDPYFGNQEGFNQVFAALQAAIEVFLDSCLHPELDRPQAGRRKN